MKNSLVIDLQWVQHDDPFYNKTIQILSDTSEPLLLNDSLEAAG